MAGLITGRNKKKKVEGGTKRKVVVRTQEIYQPPACIYSATEICVLFLQENDRAKKKDPMYTYAMQASLRSERATHTQPIM